MPIKFTTMKDACATMTAAMNSGDNAKIEAAWNDICTAISANAKAELEQDFEEYRQTNDAKILERRGIRQLTSTEKKFYNQIIDAMKSHDPKQAFIDILTDSENAMPETIIEDVIRGITQEHPLLSEIDVHDVGYLTRWILNSHSYQSAVFGSITAAIETEIASSIKVVELKQNKLSCFAILEQGMVDLGPEWLDSYIRAVLTESMSYGLEAAVISGTGSSEPVGMDRDLDAETNGVYSQKTATAVTDFTPATYGPLVATLAKDENGKARSIAGLALIVNETTYLSKVMPAITLLNNNGQYVNTAFPVATKIIISNAVDDNYGILGVPANYFLGIGKSARANTIQYSDEYKFIDDQRVFKVVRYADGIAVDNNAFILLDLSNLEAASINVTTTTAAAEG